VFLALTNSSGSLSFDVPPEVWEISILTNESTELYKSNVRPPLNGELPSITFSASAITKTSTYFTRIRRRVGPTESLLHDEIIVMVPTVLTAPAVTSGGGGNTNMFYWLNNAYWYLTDLQVNLGTREVTHRHGTVEIKPNDTISFAVLFHNGSTGVDPVATDLRLAVRSASNASADHFWSAATVTTASVSGDTYYTITVTASDEDLLAAQAAGLLAGSNAAQSLLAEVQWTTTRGTFSSDTFTISVPNEVVREPDV